MFRATNYPSRRHFLQALPVMLVTFRKSIKGRIGRRSVVKGAAMCAEFNSNGLPGLVVAPGDTFPWAPGHTASLGCSGGPP